MHSHERTLIASLGFSDPDKADTKHQLACKFLVSSGIGDRFILKLEEKLKKMSVALGNSMRADDLARAKIKIEVERCVTKGEGQYLSTIGFLDVSFSARVGTRNDVVSFIEVKTNKIPIMDVIRQIKFYNSYVNPILSPVLATTYDISKSDRNMMDIEDIFHVRLGPKFEEFCADQSNNEPSQDGALFYRIASRPTLFSVS